MGRRPPTHIDDPLKVGARIRAHRQARGLSLSGLSFPGASKAFLSRVESGTRVPSPRALREIGRRLGVAPEELAGRPLDDRVPEAQLLAAELAARLGDDDAAERLVECLEQAEALGDVRGRCRLLEALGEMAASARDDARAVALLEQARDADPRVGPRERPSLFAALGRAYAGLGDVSRATAVLREALAAVAAEPADPALVVRFGTYLANAYSDAGRLADAEEVLSEVLQHERSIADPLAHARINWSLARTYSEQGLLELAERYARLVLAHFIRGEELATRGRAHLLLAGILIDRSAAADAVPHLADARRLMESTSAGPELALVSLEEARAAYLAGDIERSEEKARETLRETEATEPAVAAAAYRVLARAALADGRLDDARFLCAQALDSVQGPSAPYHRAESLHVLAEVE